MRAEGLLSRSPEADLPRSSTRLIVAWQDPDPTVRLISPVGLLEQIDEGYRFRYIRRALALEHFRPILGFPRLNETYESETLFPFFSQRLMTPRRSDYSEYLDHLNLAADAEPMEILARSQGRRHGDRYQLLPEPLVDLDGSTKYSFLVNGVRHALDEDPSIEHVLASLTPGDPLALLNDESNNVNPRAILVTADSRDRLGWVPDLLLGYIHEVCQHSHEVVRVVHVNGPDTDPHFRLLAEIVGHVRPGYDLLAGPDWLPA
jgi:hypothetical protein